MSNEIECITDQLLGFTEEVETVVSTFIRKGYKKTRL